MEREAQEPFDLGSGPLLRGRLLRLAAEEHRSVADDAPHRSATAGRWECCCGKWRQLYGAYARGEESPLPELEMQYGDYAVWQREWLQGGELERQLGYWREQLAGAPAVLELPQDRARPAVQTHRGATAAV